MKKFFGYMFILVVTIFPIMSCGEPASPYHVWNLGTVEVGTPQVITDLLPADSKMGQTYIFTAGVTGLYTISVITITNPLAGLQWYVVDPYSYCESFGDTPCSGLTVSLNAGTSYTVRVYEYYGQATEYTIRIDASI